jgi:dGTPase
MIRTIRETGIIGMDGPTAEALAAFRTFNYETIYLRGPSREQAQSVVHMLRALVENFVKNPMLIPNIAEQNGEVSDVVILHEAVAYVAGMTDRFACRSAVALLDWPEDKLPSGIDR